MYVPEAPSIGVDAIGPLIENLDYSVFVIALDRTAPRAEPLLQSLTAEGITYESFSAVDGYNIKLRHLLDDYEFTGLQLKAFQFFSPEDKATSQSKASLQLWHSYGIDCSSPAQKLMPNSDEVNFTYCRTPGWSSSPGHLGLFCSSRALWEYIANNDLKHALIFEEDSSLLPNFREQFENSVINLPSNWSFLYLDILGYNHNNFTSVWDNDYTQLINLKDNMLVSAHAYMINSATAKMLLAETNEAFVCCIDIAIDKLVREKNLKAYKTVKSLVTTDYRVSETNQMGVAEIS